jgi:hypothetical protein
MNLSNINGLRWCHSIRGNLLFSVARAEHVFGDIIKRSVMAEVRFAY